ncbi:MAG: TRAP transporter large permease subunit [Deltaproteobacteria bacterium]
MEFTDFLVILMFVTFIGFLLTGYPVSFCLAGTAILFTGVGYLSDQYLGTLTGLDLNYFGIAVTRIYKIMSNWVLVSLPMFIYMGLMLDQSGIAENLLKSSQHLFGRVRGGLAVTATLIGVLMAASTGIIGASVVLLGLLSVPAMLSQGYSKALALGTVAGAGTLGILIPPSIMLVVMADQLGLSVGDLFLGAIFPGIILAALYVVYLLVYCYLRPDAAPLPEDLRRVTLRIFWEIFQSIIPPLLLIVAVLGSIFMGIATVTEASGVGALGATLLALANRRLNFHVLKEVLYATFNTNAYIFGILIGATCFALVLRGLGGDEFIERALSGLPFGPYGIIAFILFCVFLLGFFLDWVEITLIILPLIAPVVSSLDINIPGFGVLSQPELVWFLLLMAVTLQTSFLTPPVGFAIFYLKGVAPEGVELADIYRGVIPFIILQLVGLLVVGFWPSLVTWLPAMVYR